VEPVFDRGHDTEISATAAQAPVKIGVLLVVRPQEPCVGGHDIEGGGIIAGEPEAPTQSAEPAAERETRGTRVRDGSRGGGQLEGGAFMVELPKERPRLEMDSGPRHEFALRGRLPTFVSDSGAGIPSLLVSIPRLRPREIEANASPGTCAIFVSLTQVALSAAPNEAHSGIRGRKTP
jgi:hypothetical protein